ncbi:MAG: BadF/BadG/BcrA/BcrD ATPase family protein [Myxococcota bacterium]|jgi:hypothetical protein|nr:BadF/BadG/BcrA/BcrD ATPase family protein [Myxococcota bacterium]
MIDVVCDAGARYVKLALARPGETVRVLSAHAQDAVDLSLFAQRALSALNPGRLEAVRFYRLEEDLAERPSLLARVRAVSPLRRWAPMQQLESKAVWLKCLSLLDQEALLLDAGALRCRVFERLQGGTKLRVVENERCTAGGGRFVELMTQTLGVGLEDLDLTVSAATKPALLSSPCPVFAESEVVSLLNAGSQREDVLAGVVNDVVDKLLALLGRAQLGQRPVYLVGGLGRWQCIRSRLEQQGIRLLEELLDPLFVPCVAGLMQVQQRRQWARIEV